MKNLNLIRNNQPETTRPGFNTPTLNINRHSQISFNKAAIELLSLKKGMRFSFGSDPETKAWYIVQDNELGFSLIDTKDSYCIKSKSLCAHLFANFENVEGKSLKLIIGCEKEQAPSGMAWPIIPLPKL